VKAPIPLYSYSYVVRLALCIVSPSFPFTQVALSEQLYHTFSSFLPLMDFSLLRCIPRLSSQGSLNHSSPLLVPVGGLQALTHIPPIVLYPDTACNPATCHHATMPSSDNATMPCSRVTVPRTIRAPRRPTRSTCSRFPTHKTPPPSPPPSDTPRCATSMHGILVLLSSIPSNQPCTTFTSTYSASTSCPNPRSCSS
jgi:hypothetical protein